MIMLAVVIGLVAICGAGLRLAADYSVRSENAEAIAADRARDRRERAFAAAAAFDVMELQDAQPETAVEACCGIRERLAAERDARDGDELVAF